MKERGFIAIWLLLNSPEEVCLPRNMTFLFAFKTATELVVMTLYFMTFHICIIKLRVTFDNGRKKFLQTIMKL